MNMKDSIELAEKLSKEYRDLEKMDREIRDKEKVLDTPVMPYQKPARDVSLYETGMHVILTVIGVIAVLFIDASIMIWAMMVDWDAHTGRNQHTAWIMILISNIALIALITFIKHIREKKTEQYLAEQKVKQESFVLQRRAEMRKELAGLRQKRFEVREDLVKYEVRIPPEFRSGYYMVKVKMMLQNGKAQSFDEAIGLLVQTAQ